MNTERIVKTCLFGNLNDAELIAALEAEISALNPFDHSKNSSLDACGINENDLPTPQVTSGTASQQVEALEKLLTKRQITYLFFSLYVKHYKLLPEADFNESSIAPKGIKKEATDSRLKEPQESKRFSELQQIQDMLDQLKAMTGFRN